MKVKKIIFNKYMYVILLVIVFVLFIEDDSTKIETRISNITKNDGINSTLKLGKAIFDKCDIGSTYVMSEEEVYEYYNIKRLELKNVAVYASLMPSNINEITIIEMRNKNEREKILEKLNYRLLVLEDKWKDTDDKKYKKVKNAIIKVRFPYVIMIISDENVKIAEEFDKIINEIEK